MRWLARGLLGRDKLQLLLWAAVIGVVAGGAAAGYRMVAVRLAASSGPLTRISWMPVVCFLAHYHTERNHQGLDNRLIEPGEEVGSTACEAADRERLVGMLRYYYRNAA